MTYRFVDLLMWRDKYLFGRYGDRYSALLGNGLTGFRGGRQP